MFLFQFCNKAGDRVTSFSSMIAVCAPFSAVAYCVFGSVGGFRVTQLDRVRPRVQLSNEWYREDSDVAVPVKLNELKRIAIISGSFRPGWSYQENIWAERLAKRGIEVTVVCPRSRVTDSKGLPFTVKGVSTWGFESRQLLHERDVGPVVADPEPQCILWFGPPQRFGLSLIKERSLEQTPCAILWSKSSHAGIRLESTKFSDSASSKSTCLSMVARSSDSTRCRPGRTCCRKHARNA